ncbi:hypothetical protein GCM10028781_22480 [Nostocoides australiense]
MRTVPSGDSDGREALIAPHARVRGWSSAAAAAARNFAGSHFAQVALGEDALLGGRRGRQVDLHLAGLQAGLEDRLLGVEGGFVRLPLVGVDLALAVPDDLDVDAIGDDDADLGKGTLGVGVDAGPEALVRPVLDEELKVLLAELVAAHSFSPYWLVSFDGERLGVVGVRSCRSCRPGSSSSSRSCRRR